MKRPVTLFLPILLTTCVSLHAQEFLPIHEAGNYELRAFVKPAVTTIKEVIRLQPTTKGNSLRPVRSTDHHGRVRNILELAPAQELLFDWAPADGTSADLDLQKFSAFSLPRFSGLQGSTTFVIDTDQDGRPDTNIVGGDMGHSGSAGSRSIEFPFESETIGRTSLLVKSLRRLGLYRYDTWRIDLTKAGIVRQDGSRFDVFFSRDGEVHFKKDVWKLPAIDQLGFITFNYESENRNLVPYILLRFNNRKPFSPEIFIEEEGRDAGGSLVFDIGAALAKKGYALESVAMDRVQCGFRYSKGGKASFRLLNLEFNFNTGPRIHRVERNGIIYDALDLDITSGKAPKMLKAFTELKNATNAPVLVAFDDLAFSTEESYQVPLALVEGITESIADQAKPGLIDGTSRMHATSVWTAPVDGSLLAGVPIDGTEAGRSVLLRRFEVDVEANPPLTLRALFEQKGSTVIDVQVSGTNLGTRQPFLDIFKARRAFDEQYANCLIQEISVLADYSAASTPADDIVLKRLDLARVRYEPFDQKVQVSGLGLTLSKPDDKKREFSINGALSKNDLMEGGSWITVNGKLELEQGEYEVAWEAGDEFVIDEVLAVRDNVYIYSSAERESPAGAPVAMASSGRLVSLALVVLVLAAGVGLFIVARRKGWVSTAKDLSDRVFSNKRVFFPVQIALTIVGVWLVYRQLPSGDPSIGLLFLLLSYTLWVRYYLRTWASRRWKSVEQHRTVLYFGAAIVGLVLCAVLTMINKHRLAESAAIMVYFLLVEGVGIEIAVWIRDRKQVEL